MSEPLDDERLDDDAEAPRRRGLDPLAKRMIVASGFLVLLILSVMGAIVYFASLGKSVPRTAVERDAIVALQKAQANPKDPNAWIQLASADIEADKYDEAATAIATLQKMTTRSIVMLLKGDLASAKGDISGARGYYTQAVEQAKKDQDADVASAVANGISRASVPPSRQLIAAYIALGRLDVVVKDYAAGVKHLQAAVKLDPTGADALASLGDAQSGAGDTKAAQASYQAALKYVPDYAPALDGLKRLKGGQ